MLHKRDYIFDISSFLIIISLTSIIDNSLMSSVHVQRARPVRPKLCYSVCNHSTKARFRIRCLDRSNVAAAEGFLTFALLPAR